MMRTLSMLFTIFTLDIIHCYETSKTFKSDQAHLMEELYENNLIELSDVQFMIGENRTKMHGIKALLANISPILKQQLYDTNSYNDDQCIEFGEISPNTFKSIIRTSLSLDPIITIENAHELLKAAKKFQIKSLAAECRYFLINHVSNSKTGTDTNSPQHVIVPGLPIVQGAFSHATIVDNKQIWISGTIPAYIDPYDDTQKITLIDGGIKEQTKFILETIEKVLYECGSSFAYITNMRIFIHNNTASRYRQMNEAYVEFFKQRGLDVCARITVGANGLALGADVEIDGTAIVKPRN